MYHKNEFWCGKRDGAGSNPGMFFFFLYVYPAAKETRNLVNFKLIENKIC